MNAPASVLDDPCARMAWMNTLVNRARPVVDHIDTQVRSAELSSEVKNCASSYAHVRYTFAEHMEVPAELGFLIANNAVNARSFLDISVQRIATVPSPRQD